MARSEQEQIAVTVITAMARAEFFGDPDGLRFVQNHREGLLSGWLPRNVTFVSQHQSRERVLIQHSEEPGPSLQVSAPVVGSLSTTALAASKMVFDLGNTSHLFQDTSGVRLDWQVSEASYVVHIDPTSVSINSFGWIGFRIGQSFEPNNAPGQDQDFTIVFEDNVTSVSAQASTIQRLVFPDQFSQLGTEPKTVMQTFRIPLSELRQAGLATRHLRRITFLFNQTPSGTLYLDGLQVSN